MKLCLVFWIQYNSGSYFLNVQIIYAYLKYIFIARQYKGHEENSLESRPGRT